MSAQAQSLSLVHRYRPARQTGAPDASTQLLILLHGLGSNEDDLFGLAPYFDPRWSIISARAPMPYDNGGYAWFDLGFTAQGLSIDLEVAARSRDAVATFVREAQAAYGCRPSRTVLGGFSQGAIMSASVLLTEPTLVAGAVLMSGLVLPDLPLAPHAQLAHKPVLVTHGEFDEVLPVQFARSSHEVLQSLGLTVEYHEYAMGHTLSEACIEDIDAWLGQRLASM